MVYFLYVINVSLDLEEVDPAAWGTARSGFLICARTST